MVTGLTLCLKAWAFTPPLSLSPSPLLFKAASARNQEEPKAHSSY